MNPSLDTGKTRSISRTILSSRFLIRLGLPVKGGVRWCVRFGRRELHRSSIPLWAPTFGRDIDDRRVAAAAPAALSLCVAAGGRCVCVRMGDWASLQ